MLPVTHTPPDEPKSQTLLLERIAFLFRLSSIWLFLLKYDRLRTSKNVFDNGFRHSSSSSSASTTGSITSINGTINSFLFLKHFAFTNSILTISTWPKTYPSLTFITFDICSQEKVVNYNHNQLPAFGNNAVPGLIPTMIILF